MPEEVSACETGFSKNLQLGRTFWSIVHTIGQKKATVLNAKYLAEEKEKERYELRERNSDLRLQVYELEKRSQLLGQSLQVRPVACVESNYKVYFLLECFSVDQNVNCKHFPFFDFVYFI